MDSRLMLKFLRQTEVVLVPKRALATFGATIIDYFLVSPVEELADRTRLREGRVRSEKPKILTPESFRERFEGFGSEAGEFARWLTGQYGEALKSLEYNFKNQDMRTSVVSEPPAQVISRIRGDLDRRESSLGTVISCPDAAWSLALMKFTVDEAIRSFPVHLRDLDRRGLFNPEAAAQARREREIEDLFAAAKRDRARLDELGRKLREYGLFDRYEARFLSFF